MNEWHEAQHIQRPDPPNTSVVPSEPPSTGWTHQPGVPMSPPVYGQPMQAPAQPGPSGGSNLAKVMLAVVAVTIIALVGAIGYLLTVGNDQTAKPSVTVNSSTPDSSDATAVPEKGLPPAARLPVPDSVPVDPASLTETQQRAAAAAEWYVGWAKGASRAETIEWLTNENADEIFTVEDATAGVDSIGEDWVENARVMAEQYLSDRGYSRLGLLTQMTGSHTNQFTVHQATTAVDSMNIDWDAQAVRFVEHSVEYGTYSRGWLLYMMTETDDQDFTPEQANTALDSADVDWNAEAVEEAESIRDHLPDLTCDEALEYMQGDTNRFEPDQARHGLDTVGVC